MRKCIVKGKLKYFHQWTAVKGIVEDVRDGTVEQVPLEDIKFIDIPEGEFFKTVIQIEELEKDILDGKLGKLHNEEQCSTYDKVSYIQMMRNPEQCGYCSNCNCPIPKNTLHRNQYGNMICKDCHSNLMDDLDGYHEDPRD